MRGETNITSVVMGGVQSDINGKWNKPNGSYILQATESDSFDKTYNITYPQGCTKLIFTIMKPDNNRILGTTEAYTGYFFSTDSAVYVSGFFDLGVRTAVNAVFIYKGNSQIEVACDRSIKFRIYAE